MTAAADADGEGVMTSFSVGFTVGLGEGEAVGDGLGDRERQLAALDVAVVGDATST